MGLLREWYVWAALAVCIPTILTIVAVVTANRVSAKSAKPLRKMPSSIGSKRNQDPDPKMSLGNVELMNRTHYTPHYGMLAEFYDFGHPVTSTAYTRHWSSGLTPEQLNRIR